ncbi:MAG TPA: ATP-binding protein [Solirubrobacteraceae bacterium]|nr:ATP-binding protein [Solirubrobacteraceae bacterium]
MSAIAIGLSSVSGSRPSRRSVMRFVVVAGAVAGLAATAATAWAAGTSRLLVDPTGTAVWRSLVVATYVAAGTYTSLRRPGNRLGPIITGAGFVYTATSLTVLRAPVAYGLGETALVVAMVYTAWMYLVFPGGRLESRLERGFVVAVSLSVALLWGLILLLSPVLSLPDSLLGCSADCPKNGLHVVSASAGTVQALSTGLNIVLTVLLIGASLLVFHRARSGSNPRRRGMIPLATVFIASLIGWVVALFVDTDSGMSDALRIAEGVLLVAVPVAILVRQIHGDISAAKSLGRIAVHASASPLTAPAVQRVIGDALGDSTVTLALWNSAHRGYTDVYGAPLDVPHDGRARGLTSVTQDDRPLAALLHDPMLDTDSDILGGLAATALMLIEKTRLVDELRASRTRIVATAERERQRLERDLHDGAQNRLIAIQVKLRLAQRARGGDDLTELLEAISNDAAEAVEELRALARGIYPSVLRDRGVADALRSFAMRAPIPVSVADEGIARCSPGTEAAIYFCSLEAIQNAVKHAGPEANVTVTLKRHGRGIRFVVADDGAGMDMSTASEGVGFTSMRDRIAAVGGELEVSSSPGQGTSVQGTVPDDGYALTPWQPESVA